MEKVVNRKAKEKEGLVITTYGTGTPTRSALGTNQKHAKSVVTEVNTALTPL